MKTGMGYVLRLNAGRRLAMNVCFILAVGVGGLVTVFGGETNYHSPIDGKSYRADWVTYNPSNTPALNPPVGRVQHQEIRLLSTQEAFDRGIDVAELADFIRKTEHAIDTSDPVTNGTFELLLQTRLTKEARPAFEMASKGDVSRDALQKIYEGLNRLPDYRSRADDLRYEERFTITNQPQKIVAGNGLK